MKFTLFAVAVLCFSLVAAARTEADYLKAWMEFTAKYQKTYKHDEVHYRYKIFKATADFVDAHNAKGLSYTVAINQFSDLTNEEFQTYFMGTHVDATTHVRKGEKQAESSAPVPASWDWRDKGAVTPVKDQGQCGSCWSFSTTGSTEGCHFITTGQLVGLSEQNLVDCSTAQGNEGCNGGLMDQAFQYIIANKGIDTEASYPYTAEDGTCTYSASNCASTLAKYTDVTSGSESALQQAVYGAPVSVAIDASQPSFQSYSSGVYYEPSCSSTQLDHGVLAVGWGTDGSGNDYWIVKNSWSASWGMNGYILMSRNKNNNCGIATMASYPSSCGNC
jgi:cathepsin L